MWTLEMTSDKFDQDRDINRDFGVEDSANTQESEQVIEAWWNDDK